MRFGILGPLQVIDEEGREVAVTSPIERGLLALLVVNAGRPVGVDRLVEELWGDEGMAGDLRGRLRYHVSKLRGTLQAGGGGPIVTTPDGYLLDAAPGDVDAACFERLLVEARRRLPSDPRTALARLEEGVALWRGPALAGVAAPFAESEARRLEEVRLSAVEEQIEAELLVGRHRGLVAGLEKLVAEYPFRERLWGQLMLALYRCDRQAEAVRAGARLRTLLRDELGLEPSAAIRDLEDRILQRDPSLGIAPEVAGNLPFPVSDLVGRTAELAELDEMVERHRVITLVGPAGVGKTRLALEAAHRIRGRFPDGAWFVELGSLTRPETVADSVASDLGAPHTRSDPLAALIDHLRARRALVVIDNCEHLIEAVAGLVAEVTRSCPMTHVLATSREPLRVAGEVISAVEPLAFPEHPVDSWSLRDFDAVELFCRRAAAVSPGFRLDGDNAAAVASLCARLDGLPLAIELAAASSRSLSPDQLLARIDDRFRLLTVGERTALEHHRTLEAAIAWSYDQLTPDLQRLFRALGVFAGFTLEAAEEVCSIGHRAAIAPALSVLVGGSLVRRTETERGTPRYSLLETVRAFALARLAEAGQEHEYRQRHLRYYTALAADFDRDVAASIRAGRLQVMEPEMGNFRGALDWAAGHDGGAGLHLAARLAFVWDELGWSEGGQWLERLLEQSGELAPPADRARALLAAGNAAFKRGDLDNARLRFETAWRMYEEAGDAERAASSLNGLGAVASMQRDRDTARRLFEQAIDVAGRGGGFGKLDALHNLGLMDLEDYRPEAAARRFTEGLELARAAGIQEMAGMFMLGLGHLARLEADLDTAEAYVDGCLVDLEEHGGPEWRTYGYLGKAMLERDGGRLQAAAGWVERALDHVAVLGGGIWCAECLATGLTVLADMGEAGPAVTLAGALSVLAGPREALLHRLLGKDVDRRVEQCRAVLDPAAVEGAYRAGAAMGIGDALRYLGEALAEVSGRAD